MIRQPFKGLQKGFVIGTLGLFLADLLGDFLKASLGLVEALRQGVVPFLVFGLISIIWSCLVAASDADDRSEEYWRNKEIEKER